MDTTPLGYGRARSIALRAQTFPTDDAYMESFPWFPVERSDRADPEVRW